MSSYDGDYYYAQSDDDYSDRFDSDRYDYDHYDNSYDGDDGGGHEGYDDGYDTGRQDDHEAAQDDANTVPARRHDSDSSDSSDSDDERLAYYFRRYAPTGTPSASDPIAAQPQHHVDRSQQAPVSEDRWNSEARQRPRASGASALIFGFEDNPLPFYSAPGWPHPDSRSPHAPHPTPLSSTAAIAGRSTFNFCTPLLLRQPVR
ncbi:unnamed protein product [Tilletia controversa]|uniref:Uncharacterized protein n=1 Tax=Tilletia controversa TaxID=13291 RepID=A0A8X7MYD1_9BASI|nr:hypothetical protein A4X06_0g2040 [Tilletia controversa]CAD6884782.1 unnamed protein product [Tilletia caries]CAD6914223.1 unnamed protein product [Tilletia controversa]CAD6952128.1 unnamed protein product [Tilletia controversa]CAD6967879.1 unnamed protein product [Tilletia controversa]